MAQPFEVGEIVYLNSGSPAMTVFNLLPDDFVRVTWMAGAEVRSTKFPRAALTRESPGFEYRADPVTPVAVTYDVVSIDPEIERRAMEIYKEDGICRPNYLTVAASWADEQEKIREMCRDKARAEEYAASRAKGGFAAAAKLTPDERSERGRKGAEARWGKK